MPGDGVGSVARAAGHGVRDAGGSQHGLRRLQRLLRLDRKTEPIICFDIGPYAGVDMAYPLT